MAYCGASRLLQRVRANKVRGPLQMISSARRAILARRARGRDAPSAWPIVNYYRSSPRSVHLLGYGARQNVSCAAGRKADHDANGFTWVILGDIAAHATLNITPTTTIAISRETRRSGTALLHRIRTLSRKLVFLLMTHNVAAQWRLASVRCSLVMPRS